LSIVVLVLVGCRAPNELGLVPGDATSLRISFTPQSDSFAAAAATYDSLWRAEGPRITSTMQAITGLTFESQPVEAIVYEGISQSGFRAIPMRLRASYPVETKKATLIHELGHRLESGLFPASEDDHPALFLWLYDAWTALYGQAFADAQVAVERRRGGVYPAAWDAALAMTPAERASKFREIVEARRGR
jgi:hypothetical protein